jgi:hypothetical protein
VGKTIATLSPTDASVKDLRKAGLQARTFQGFQLRPEHADLLVIDKASMLLLQNGYRLSAGKLIGHLGSLADEPLSETTKNDLIKFRNALSSSGLASKTICGVSGR